MRKVRTHVLRGLVSALKLVRAVRSGFERLGRRFRVLKELQREASVAKKLEEPAEDFENFEGLEELDESKSEKLMKLVKLVKLEVSAMRMARRKLRREARGLPYPPRDPSDFWSPQPGESVRIWREWKKVFRIESSLGPLRRRFRQLVYRHRRVFRKLREARARVLKAERKLRKVRTRVLRGLVSALRLARAVRNGFE